MHRSESVKLCEFAPPSSHGAAPETSAASAATKQTNEMVMALTEEDVWSSETFWTHSKIAQWVQCARKLQAWCLMFQPGFPTLSSSLQQIYDTTYSLSLSPSWVFAMFCQGAPLGPILRYGFPWAPSQNKRFNGHSLRDIKRGATTSLGAFFDVWLPLVALWCGASAKK